MSRGRASCRIPCVSRILVIDDDQGVRETVQRMLRAAGYTVQTAESGEDGLALARGGAFDVILSDMRMTGISGIEVLRRLREQRVDSAFIVMTAFGTVDTAVEAMKLGAVDFVQKPFFRDELLMRVLAAADRRQLARQVDLLQRQIGGSDTLAALVGESDPMQRLKALIARAAAANGTVLITGETGTGKELVARAIHTESPRAARPPGRRPPGRLRPSARPGGGEAQPSGSSFGGMGWNSSLGRAVISVSSSSAFALPAEFPGRVSSDLPEIFADPQPAWAAHLRSLR